MGRGVALVAIGLEADVLRLVDQEEDDDQRDHDQGHNWRPERDPPAVAVGEPRRERQQQELAGGAGSAEYADRKSAPRGKPAGCNQSAQHHGGKAGAEADDDAPEQHQMPELRHDESAEKPNLDQPESDQHHAFEAVFVDQRRGKRRHQAEQDNPQRERDRYLLGAPAEFLGQRNDQRAGDAHASGGGEREEEDDRDDRPAVMDAGARQPLRQGLSEHAESLQARYPTGAFSSKRRVDALIGHARTGCQGNETWRPSALNSVR